MNGVNSNILQFNEEIKNEIQSLNNYSKYYLYNKNYIKALETYGESLLINRNQPKVLREYAMICYTLSNESSEAEEKVKFFKAASVAFNFFFKLEMEKEFCNTLAEYVSPPQANLSYEEAENYLLNLNYEEPSLNNNKLTQELNSIENTNKLINWLKSTDTNNKHKKAWKEMLEKI